MRGLLNLLLWLAIVLFIDSCNVDSCFKNPGSQRVQTVDVDSFAMVYVNGVFDIELVQDTNYYIEIKAQEEVLSFVELEVKDYILSCYNYNSCFWRGDFDRPSLVIHFSDIRELNVYESSYIFSTDSITDSFKFTIQTDIAETDVIFNNEEVFFYIHKTCGGRFNFSGKTNKAFLMNFNAGLFEMSELVAKQLKVLNYSVIDMKVNAVDAIDAEIHNSGNIYYKGNPEVITDSLSSTGRLIPLVE
jgi:hypothetical protein